MGHPAFRKIQLEILITMTDPSVAFLQSLFQTTNEPVQSGKLDLYHLEPALQRAITAFYPHAIIAYLCGSAATGNFKPYSDIDMIVIVEQSCYYERRCVIFEGYPLDLQILGLDHIHQVVSRAMQSGIGYTVHALIEGRIILNKNNQAVHLQAWVNNVIKDGPAKPSQQAVDMLRMMITDLTVDLCTAVNSQERIATGLALYHPLMNLFTPKEFGWIVGEKRIPRKLAAINNDLYERLIISYTDLLTDKPDGLIALANEILASWGGPIFDGYVQSADIQVRKPANAKLAGAA